MPRTGPPPGGVKLGAVLVEGAVRFAEITASPTYQSGPELARALVSLIQDSEAGDAVRARHP